ncbi:MAG TPA: hypothetical protein VHZ24_07225 [Pirellulales bacterium]|jgi:hypothetical protein|nr:hypothetical protein [Pirellulales bacterium]
MNRLLNVALALGDRTNPVTVKELRQAVQSRLVIGILLLFLLANVLTVCLYVLVNPDNIKSERAGQVLFSILFVVLVLTSMIFVPLYAAVRLTMERNDSNIDLLFITTIAPAAIVRGKFLAAVALTALIYSTCLPFLTLTYLLRGIDLPSIFSALAVAFLMTSLAIMFAIFVGSIAGGLLVRLFLGAGFLFIGAWLLIYTILAGMGIVQMGFASMFSSREAWAIFGVCLALGLFAMGLMYLLAVAAVSARSSNRMFPFRVFMTVCWLLFGAAFVGWSLIEKSDMPVLMWSMTCAGMLSAMLIFVLAEREHWTVRVKRRIPRFGLGRFLAWLLFTGSAGGVAWCVLLADVSVLVGFVMTADSGNYHPTNPTPVEALNVMCGLLLFAWCYGMSGVFVRRIFIRKSAPLLNTVIALVLLALGSSVPLVLAYMLEGPDRLFNQLPLLFLLGNPLVLGRPAHEQIVIFGFLLVWAIFGLLVNIRWFFDQWAAFRRYEPKPVDRPEATTPEPAVAHA